MTDKDPAEEHNKEKEEKEMKRKTEAICCMCLKVDRFEHFASDLDKYLCMKCYKKRRKEFKKKYPDESLRLKWEKKQ